MIGSKEIKLRIKGIKNIQQITKAMQMVSAAKLRRFQEKTILSRPYEYKLNETIKDIRKASERNISHPLFIEREPKNIHIVLFTSDKGLCGSFNSNVIQIVLTFIKKNTGKEISFTIIGKKGYDFFNRRGYKIDNFFNLPPKEVSPEYVENIVSKITDGYTTAKFDEVFLFFTRFGTPMKSDPTSLMMLPLRNLGDSVEGKVESKQKVLNTLLEPSGENLLISIMPQYLKTQIYKALIETITSEHGARMVGMRTATDNAEEILSILVLNYNRARQAAITTEILEVASGAEALKRKAE